MDCARPLTALPHGGVSPWTGNPSVMPEDDIMLKEARQAADDAVAKAGKHLAERPSVTVTAKNGLAG